MVTLFTTLRAKDLHSAREIEARLFDLVRAVPREPGNIDYNAFAIEEQPNTYYIIERWASQADAERHAKQVDNDGLVDEVSAFLVEPPETVVLKRLLDPSVAATEQIAKE
jgi:quinol monooxygenase YgiN